MPLIGKLVVNFICWELSRKEIPKAFRLKLENVSGTNFLFVRLFCYLQIQTGGKVNAELMIYKKKWNLKKNKRINDNKSQSVTVIFSKKLQFILPKNFPSQNL